MENKKIELVISGKPSFLGMGFKIMVEILIPTEKLYRVFLASTGTEESVIINFKTIVALYLDAFGPKMTKGRFGYSPGHRYTLTGGEELFDQLKDFTIKISENIDSGNLKMDFEPYEPVVILEKSRHDDAYYLANSIEELNDLYVKILKRKYENQEFEWFIETLLPFPKFSQADIDNLPEAFSDMREQLQKELDDYIKEVKDLEIRKENYRSIKKVIKENNGSNAKSLLNEFSVNIKQIHFENI